MAQEYIQMMKEFQSTLSHGERRYAGETTA